MERSLKGLTLSLVLCACWLALPGAAQAKSSGCGTGGGLLGGSGEHAPAPLAGSLEAAVLAHFGVLRRAALPSDVLPPVNPAAETIETSLVGYYESDIRQLFARPNGERFFIVPGLPRPLNLPPLRCIPKEYRKSLAKAEEEDRKRAFLPQYCIVRVGGTRSLGGSSCEGFDEVGASDPVFGVPLFEEPTAVLVPDGVASVRITGPGSISQTVAVSENAFFFEAPASLKRERERIFKALLRANAKKHATAAERRHVRRVEAALFKRLLETRAAKVEWLAASGAVVKTITPLKRGSRRQQLVIV